MLENLTIKTESTTTISYSVLFLELLHEAAWTVNGFEDSRENMTVEVVYQHRTMG